MKLLTYETWGVPTKGFFDLSKSFVTSHFVSPLVLACIRAIFCVYIFTTIIVAYSWLAHNTETVTLKDVNIDPYTFPQSKAAIGQSFSFFTYLSFWSSGVRVHHLATKLTNRRTGQFYFLVSSVHTFMFAFKACTWLQDWPKPLQLLHSLYYSCVTTVPFLVTVVFWGTMNSGWPAGRFMQWVNLSVHGLNSIFAIVEIGLSATDAPPVTHLSVVLLILSMYLGLAYLTKSTQNWYVYEWLNPAHGNVSIILHILGYAGAMVAIWFLVSGNIRLRNLLARKLCKDKPKEVAKKGVISSGSSGLWLSEVDIARPKSVRGKDKCLV